MEEYNKDKGVSLSELLVCVTIIMLIAAVVVPEVWNALDRARQHKTMSDMMLWKEALGTYFVDYSFFPFDPTGPDAPIGPGVFLYDMMLADKYLEKQIYLDRWGNNLCYTGGCDTISAWGYTLASLGKNFVAEFSPPKFHCIQCDIRLRNGVFFSRPEGYQIDNSTNGCPVAAPCL